MPYPIKCFLLVSHQGAQARGIDALQASVGARLEGAAQVVQVVHLGMHGFLLPDEADRLDRIAAAALEVRGFRDVDGDVAVQ
jgi:hypothetical protein